MEESILQHLAQFGVAGLMGILWVIERRHSNQRERELSEAHQRLMEQRTELGELIGVVRDNTAAMTALQEGQSRVARAFEQVTAELRRSRQGGGSASRRPMDQAG